MTDDAKCYKTTEPKSLEDKIMNSNIPKSEAEWWANTEIHNLRSDVECLIEQRNYYMAKVNGYEDHLTDLTIKAMGYKAPDIIISNAELHEINKKLQEELERLRKFEEEFSYDRERLDDLKAEIVQLKANQLKSGEVRARWMCKYCGESFTEGKRHAHEGWGRKELVEVE